MTRRAPTLILPAGVDPPSLPSRPAGRPIFDASPHRNRDMPKAPELAPGVMNEVIATVVAFGMPRAEAEEARRNPYVRVPVVQLYCLIRDAQEGDVPAKRALDRIRFAFNHRENLAEAFGAKEQPMNPDEAKELLGLD